MKYTSLFPPIILTTNISDFPSFEAPYSQWSTNNPIIDSLEIKSLCSPNYIKMYTKYLTDTWNTMSLHHYWKDTLQHNMGVANTTTLPESHKAFQQWQCRVRTNTSAVAKQASQSHQHNTNSLINTSESCAGWRAAPHSASQCWGRWAPGRWVRPSGRPAHRVGPRWGCTQQSGTRPRPRKAAACQTQIRFACGRLSIEFPLLNKNQTKRLVCLFPATSRTGGESLAGGPTWPSDHWTGQRFPTLI